MYVFVSRNGKNGKKIILHSLCELFVYNELVDDRFNIKSRLQWKAPMHDWCNQHKKAIIGHYILLLGKLRLDHLGLYFSTFDTIIIFCLQNYCMRVMSKEKNHIWYIFINLLRCSRENAILNLIMKGVKFLRRLALSKIHCITNTSNENQ